MRIMLSLFMALWFTMANLTAGFGAETIKLPEHSSKGTVSVEEALQNRRSTRQFADRPPLGLGSGIVGVANDKAVAQALQLPQNDTPLLVMPLGYKQ